MKNFLTVTLSLITYLSFAQGPKNIVLTKGQEIEISTTSNSQIEMSMGMTMSNNTATTSKLVVVDEDQENYKLTNTLIKMKTSVEGMGQNFEYDSDKPEDKDSEVGKAMGGKLNKSESFLLNKTNGKITALSSNDSDEKSGGMSGMSFGSADGGSSAGDGFLVIGSDKQVGDTWSETVKLNGMTTVKNYKILSIANDVATVEIKGTIKGTTNQEAQGNSVKMTTDATIEGKITSNIKTSMVYMIKMDADISGTVETMGQEMPVTTKTSTTTLYNQ